MFTGLLKEEEGGGSYLPDPGQFTWSYTKEMFPTPKHFLTPYKPLGNGRLHEFHCPPPFHSRPILGGASVEITGVLISTWQPSCHTWKTESHNKYNRKGRRLKHTHTGWRNKISNQRAISRAKILERKKIHGSGPDRYHHNFLRGYYGAWKPNKL